MSKEIAVKKLKEELEKSTNKAFANPVIEHLLKRCEESESLCADIVQEHKMFDKCIKYITTKARKYLSGKSGAVDDTIVYEWAEDYYHLDDKNIEEEKAKQETEEKKAQKQSADKEKTKDKKKNTKTKEKQKLVPDENNNVDSVENSKEKSSSVKTTMDKQKKKDKNEVEGQMDLFSLMGM